MVHDRGKKWYIEVGIPSKNTEVTWPFSLEFQELIINYYQIFFQEHKQNMLKTWEGIKAIVNIRNISKKNINCLNTDDIEETDLAILSDLFNKFFTTIAQKIESKIVPTNKNYTDYLTNPSII